MALSGRKKLHTRKANGIFFCTNPQTTMQNHSLNVFFHKLPNPYPQRKNVRPAA